MEFRIAAESDLGGIMELMEQAKEHLRGLDVDQWQDGYPDENVILRDIAEKSGYMLMDSGEIAGYVCISFEAEENYQVIEGRWKSGQPYAVIHRIAVDNAYKGKGLTARMFAFAEELCGLKDIHRIKIDTHEKNFAMRRILKKNRYEYCGIIRFNGCERIAFEKVF